MKTGLRIRVIGIILGMAVAFALCPTAQALDVSGTYKTNLNGATLVLVSAEGVVTGTYADGKGSLSGSLDGMVLSGTYRWESKTDNGRFRFEFAEDAAWFKGSWGQGLNKELDGKWNGRRLTEPAEAAPGATVQNVAGTWNTTMGGAVLELTQEGAFVSGQYADGKGRLSGVLVGSLLKGTFRWEAKHDNGYFEFEFAPDAASFTGKWGELTGLPENKWNGNRQASK